MGHEKTIIFAFFSIFSSKNVLVFKTFLIFAQKMYISY